MLAQKHKTAKDLQLCCVSFANFHTSEEDRTANPRTVIRKKVLFAHVAVRPPSQKKRLATFSRFNLIYVAVMCIK